MSTVVQRNFRIRHSYCQVENQAEIPNLIDLQKKSYDRFLQMDVPEDQRENIGLQAAFTSIFPITDFQGGSSLEFEGYRFDPPEYDVAECLQRASSYQAKLKVKIRKVDRDLETGEILEIKYASSNPQDDDDSAYIHMGEIPLQTEKGTFIINGTERVVVTQLHRSPGVIFQHDSGKGQSSKLLYNARVIAYRGSWLDFEYDAKDVLHVRIDRRRKMHATILLRAMGFTTKEIMHLYYPVEHIEVLEENPALCKRRFFHADYLKGSSVLEKRTLKLEKYAAELKKQSVKLKLSKTMMKSLEKTSMKQLSLAQIEMIKSRRGKGEQQYLQLLEDELGDREIDWRFAESVIGTSGEVLTELNMSVDLETLINLDNEGFKSVTVFNPNSEMTRDSLVELLRKQLKVNDGSQWCLSEPVSLKGELIAPALSEVDIQLLVTLNDAGITEVSVHSVDGAEAEEISRKLFKAELRSEDGVKWALFADQKMSDHGPLLQANERLNPSSLISLSVAGIEELDVYRSVTFNAAPAMKRKHGIDISDGYVMMRTSELKGWVLANDVYSPEGEFMFGFNERLSSEEEEVDPLKDLTDRGVKSFDVFFIDDNHFSTSLMNTLKSDQGKQQETLEVATADHPLVKEMIDYIAKANEIDAENGTQEANAFGYRSDLPPQELAQIANSLRMIYSKIRPGDPAKVENSYKLLRQQFFTSDRYDLSEVGRVKLNHKFKLDVPLSVTTLTVDDIVEMIRYITALRDDNTEIYRSTWAEGEEGELTRTYTKLDIRLDDIDHLGNRRVRAVGELLENQFRNGLTRMERTIKDRLTPREDETKKDLRKLINPKPVVAVVKEYFGSSQLSQFMDQTNPLSEVTHKRRLSALGPGGLSRDRAGFEVRDVHMTHYGRICPIETPEGPNIGLISSLSTFAQINEYGFIETPYRKVKHFDAEGNPYQKGAAGPVRSKVMIDEPIEYFNALDEEYREDLWETSPQKYNNFQHVAQAKVSTDEEGWLLDSQISVRASGDFLMVPPEDLNLVDVSPNQLVSVAASLIPFLENDDANRALMGSNMQRQAVPLLVSRSPLVGTGIEYTVGRDSGVTIVAKSNGVVHSVDADRIVIIPDQDGDRVVEPEIYHLVKFRRSNQNTCINQRPIVECGDRVRKGDVIADGPSTEQGELALGQNVVVAFMPWGGYNFEDSILISERLVQEDVYTSIHIEEFECSARDFNRRGPEQITRDISTVSEEARKNLDESGIVRVGSEVRAGDILVGKTTPKGESQLEPSEKLLTAVFGNRALDVKDTSLKVRTGVVGTVIGVKVFGRNDKDVDRDKSSARIELAEETKIKRDSDLLLELNRSTTYEQLRELYVGLKAATVLRDSNSKVIFKKGETITADKIALLSDTQLIDLRLSGDDRIKEAKELLQAREEKIVAEREAKLKKLQHGDDLPTGVQKMVKVYVAIKRKLQVGDKMAGRHGNKGVISRVLPIEDMPFLEDGTPVEMVLNPLGVPSRMNIGQILETHLGWAARGLGKKISRMASDGAIESALREEFKRYYSSKAHKELIDTMSLEDLQNLAKNVQNGIHVASPVFDGAPEEKLREALEVAGLRQDARSTLFNGRTGEPFDNRVTVGVMYVLKLHHLVDEKIHARSTGPYSLVTQQPLGGKAQFGGQRLGEMEVWAMEAYGAAYTLKEFLTVKSDDLKGRTQMYESIVKGEYELRSGLPESFRVLIQELKSLALDIELLKMDSDV